MNIEDVAYLTAKTNLHLTQSYLQLHVRRRPRYLPGCVYQWLLSKLLYLTQFTPD